MLTLLALIALAPVTHAQNQKLDCRRMGFFFCEVKNPQWVIDENANRIGYYLAQRMYGENGNVKVDYKSDEHLAVTTELKKIFKKYKLMATYKGLGPLGAEDISIDEIFLSANEAFNKLTTYSFYQDYNRAEGKKELAEIQTFLALFPEKMKSVKRTAETKTYSWSTSKYYRASITTEVEASSWGKEPLEQELVAMGISKIVIEEYYELKSASDILSGDTIETIQISVEANHGKIQDMQYTLHAFLNKYSQFQQFSKLMPAKGHRIQGMVASGFQGDDVVPYTDENKQLHWIFFLPSMEGPNYFDFIIKKDSRGLVSGSTFNELCYENMNNDYFSAIQFFMDQGFIDTETMSSKNILVRNRNYGDPNLEKCTELDYNTGKYSPGKLEIRSILR